MNMTQNLADRIMSLERWMGEVQLYPKDHLHEVPQIVAMQNEIREGMYTLTWRECVCRALGYLDRVHEEAKRDRLGYYAEPSGQEKGEKNK